MLCYRGEQICQLVILPIGARGMKNEEYDLVERLPSYTYLFKCLLATPLANKRDVISTLMKVPNPH